MRVVTSGIGIKFLNQGFLILLLILSGCYYHDETDVEPTPTNGTGSEISFSTQVLPIFNAHCSLTSCHVTGGEKPNLEADQAYNNLFADNLINTQNPEASELIVRMRSISDPMPTSGNLPQVQINIIVNWIAQGAKEN